MFSRAVIWRARRDTHNRRETIEAVVSDMSSDSRPVIATSSAMPRNSTIPLEASQQDKKEAKVIAGRMDKMEKMMQSQDETLQKLTSLMAQMVSGGKKDDDS